MVLEYLDFLAMGLSVSLPCSMSYIENTLTCVYLTRGNEGGFVQIPNERKSPRFVCK